MRMNPECYYPQDELAARKRWAERFIAMCERNGRLDHPAVADERHNLRVIDQLQREFREMCNA